MKKFLCFQWKWSFLQLSIPERQKAEKLFNILNINQINIIFILTNLNDTIIIIGENKQKN